MMPLTVREIIDVSGGRLAAGALDSIVLGVATDSRAARPGDLFVPLRGEHFDGNRFAAEALAAGATATLVESGAADALCHHVQGDPALADRAVIVVDEALDALGALSSAVRGRSGARVVAITGSTGKTSTKDLLSAALDGSLKVVATAGNYNNEIGLPLTLLRATQETEAIIVEMAMRGPGQIATLTEYAAPEIGVITNVGLSHIELLGSPEAIAEAKSELALALPPTGQLIINADDSWAGFLAERTKAEVSTFGRDPGADFCIEDVVLDDQARPTWRVVFAGRPGLSVSLNVPGEHNVANATAALAAAYHLGVPLDVAAKALAKATLSEMRLNIIKTAEGVTVIDDTYNANPTSMAGALDTLNRIDPGARHIAVLGQMAELGDISDREHESLGALAAEASLDLLVGVGGETTVLVEAAAAAGLTADAIKHFSTNEAALDWLRNTLVSGDIVLVKGSRAVGLESVVAGLSREGQPL